MKARLPLLALSLLLVAGDLLLSNVAFADQFSYDLGRQQGSLTTKSAWASVSRRYAGGASVCDAVDDLVGVITRSSRRIAQIARRYSGRDMVDYAEGYIHGLRGELRQIAEQCTNKCGMIGEAAGVASAVVYCELSDLLGEIPVFIHQQDMPNITCGEPYRVQCEITFESYTYSTCPSFSGPRSPEPRLYNQYYLSSEGGACSYNPPRH